MRYTMIFSGMEFPVECWGNEVTCSYSLLNVFSWFHVAISQVLASICTLTQIPLYFFTLTILNEFCLKSYNSSENKRLWHVSVYLAQSKSKSELSFQNSQRDFEYSKAHVWIWLLIYTGEYFKGKLFITYVTIKTIEAQLPKLTKSDLQYSTWHRVCGFKGYSTVSLLDPT